MTDSKDDKFFEDPDPPPSWSLPSAATKTNWKHEEKEVKGIEEDKYHWWWFYYARERNPAFPEQDRYGPYITRSEAISIREKWTKYHHLQTEGEPDNAT